MILAASANGHQQSELTRQDSSVGADLFRRGMRALASGVSLVTTSHQGQRHGIIATSVTSLASDPPSLIVCVNRSASAHEPLSAARIFCVNFLDARHEPIARDFSDSAKRGERFGQGEWDEMGTGAPALCDALASLDCRVDQQIPYSTHSIFIAHVLQLRVRGHLEAPLIYFDRAFTRTAS